MKRFVYFLLIMLIGLQCQAVENFTLELPSATQVDGKVKSRGNKDIITLNAEQGSAYLEWLLSDSSSTTNTIASNGSFMNWLLNDPYLVQIDGHKYIMIKDNPSKKWSKNDILGIDDTKETIFKALKGLESDGDRSKITSEELKKANIRFVRIADDGAILVNDRKQDYSLEKISYIDMNRLRRLANSSVTGIFGHFNIHLKTDNNSKRIVIGYVTLHKDNSEKIIFK